MSAQKNSARGFSGGSAPKDDAYPDNYLAFFDQATFLSLRGTGRMQLMQGLWIYEHPVDLEGLRRFHRNFGHGLLGRRIERSPLPFGRHRWVSSKGPSSDIDVVERPRPRVELSDWVDERAQLPIDPEWGPGYHLGVLPLTDGSNAVSLVVSHCLADGVGGFATLADAVKGNVRDFAYPPPRSRTRVRAAVADARQAVHGAPEVGRALVAGARLVLRRRHDIGQSVASRATAIREDGADGNVVVPAITVYVDLGDWDARANTLGGTGYALLAGFAAKLGERMGRRRADDGAVTLLIPISDRTLDDTRAIAMTYVNVSVDPTQVTTDLSGARAAIRQGLNSAQAAPDEASQILPLIPFVPKRAVKRGADLLFGFSDLAVVCSNFGDLDPAVACLDGTAAEYVMLRGVDHNVTREYIERVRGQLVLVAGRIVGRMSISIVAYQPGETNSKARLRELAGRTLAEFELTGLIE